MEPSRKVQIFFAQTCGSQKSFQKFTKANGKRQNFTFELIFQFHKNISPYL